MKKLALVGFLAAFSVLGIASVLAPARAAGDGMPVGTIIAWGGQASSVPAGWMLCNGKALSKSAYAELFAAIGTSWGGGGNKFHLPDLRGRFLRGDDGGAGRDPDAKKRTPSAAGGSATGVGTVQPDSLQNHAHTQTSHSHEYDEHLDTQTVTYGPDFSVYMANNNVRTLTTDPSGANIKGATTYGTHSPLKAGEETRPENAAVNFIIKVK